MPLGCNSFTDEGKIIISCVFHAPITWFVITGEPLPSIFTKVTHPRVLSWIKRRTTGGKFCKKKFNYHDPEIEFRHFPDQTDEEASVSEEARVGQPVSIITVTDRDLEDTGRQVVNITDGNQAGHFALDSVGGVHVVRLARQLDRQTVSQYQLTITAQDGGTPTRTATATLRIRVGSEGRSSRNALHFFPKLLRIDLHYITLRFRRQGRRQRGGRG